MDRERLESIANSAVFMHRITRDEARQLIELLDSAAERAVAGTASRVDRLLADRDLDQTLAAAREMRREVVAFADRIEALTDRLGTRTPV